MVLRLLMISWCATLLELTRHGGVEVSGVSLGNFFIKNSLPRLATVMCQINRCNGFFPSAVGPLVSLHLHTLVAGTHMINRIV